MYRLGGAAELGRLALGVSFGAAVSMVEWAERLGPAAPQERLDVRFLMLPDVRRPVVNIEMVVTVPSALVGQLQEMRPTLFANSTCCICVGPCWMQYKRAESM